MNKMLYLLVLLYTFCKFKIYKYLFIIILNLTTSNHSSKEQFDIHQIDLALISYKRFRDKSAPLLFNFLHFKSCNATFFVD